MFITQVGVKQDGSAIDLYVKTMESPVWYALIISFTFSCTAFATLSGFNFKNRRCYDWNHCPSRLSSFFGFITEMFLDQCHAELPKPYRKPVVFLTILPWLLAILISTNGFKGFLKARFAMAFPYKLDNDTSWKTFVEYSLFAIVSADVCRSFLNNGTTDHVNQFSELNTVVFKSKFNGVPQTLNCALPCQCVCNSKETNSPPFTNYLKV